NRQSQHSSRGRARSLHEDEAAAVTFVPILKTCRCHSLAARLLLNYNIVRRHDQSSPAYKQCIVRLSQDFGFQLVSSHGNLFAKILLLPKTQESSILTFDSPLLNFRSTRSITYPAYLDDHLNQ